MEVLVRPDRVRVPHVGIYPIGQAGNAPVPRMKGAKNLQP